MDARGGGIAPASVPDAAASGTFTVRYISTRGQTPSLGFSDAVATGLAPDGGLFLPVSLPDLSGDLPRLAKLGYADLCLEFLRAFATDIPLATLAELADLSLYHFARAFRLSFGVPPHRYHIARRMERAKNLLEGSALSVTQIGIQIGFRDTSSFTRAYRRFAGIAPSEYRRCREAKQSIV